MSGDMPDVAVHILAVARASGSVREVHGTAYPVSLGELARWEEAQKARQCAKRKHPGARFEWRKAFR